MEHIVEGVRQNRLKIEKRQAEEKSKRDSLNIELSQLVEKARQYAKVFKDFQEVTSVPRGTEPMHLHVSILGDSRA